MPVTAIVQARMSSTRLPGKVLMEICSKPILALLVERLKASKRIERIVIATSVDATDDVIAAWCNKNSVDLFRGSLDDVLDRYYNAALTYGADTIVRITADCPLIDPALVDRVIGPSRPAGAPTRSRPEASPTVWIRRSSASRH